MASSVEGSAVGVAAVDADVGFSWFGEEDDEPELC